MPPKASTDNKAGGRSILYCRSKKAAPETIVQFLSVKFSYYTAEQWVDVVRSGGTLAPNSNTVDQVAGTSSSALPEIIPNLSVSRVYINGELIIDSSRILNQQDRVSFVSPPALEPEVDERTLVLYNDPYMVIACKSGNIPVCEGGRYRHNTLIRVVGDLLIDEGVTLFPVHRLDKETSGIVVFAKSKAMAAALGAMFAEKSEEGAKASEVEEPDEQHDQEEEVRVETQNCPRFGKRHREEVIAFVGTPVGPHATFERDTLDSDTHADSCHKEAKIEKYYVALVTIPTNGSSSPDADSEGDLQKHSIAINYRIGFEGESVSHRQPNPSATEATGPAKVASKGKSLADKMKMKCYPTKTISTAIASGLYGKPSLTVATCSAVFDGLLLKVQQEGEDREGPPCSEYSFCEQTSSFASPNSDLSETLALALLSLRLYTGRSHQIRVHLASLGMPIVGDKLYFSALEDDTTTRSRGERSWWPAHLVPTPLDRTVTDECFLARTRGTEQVTVAQLKPSSKVLTPTTGLSHNRFTLSNSQFISSSASSIGPLPTKLVATRHCLHAARLVIPLANLRHVVEDEGAFKEYADNDRLVIDASTLHNNFSDVLLAV